MCDGTLCLRVSALCASDKSSDCNVFLFHCSFIYIEINTWIKKNLFFFFKTVLQTAELIRNWHQFIECRYLWKRFFYFDLFFLLLLLFQVQHQNFLHIKRNLYYCCKLYFASVKSVRVYAHNGRLKLGQVIVGN